MLYKELCCVPGHCAAQASVSLSALEDGLLPEQLRPGLIVKDDPIRQQIIRSGLGCGGGTRLPSGEGLG